MSPRPSARIWQGLTPSVAGAVGGDRPCTLLNAASGLSQVDTSPLDPCEGHWRRTSWAIGEPSARGSLFTAPSTLSQNYLSWVLGVLGCSGATVRSLEHTLPGTRLFGSSGDLGARGPLFMTPSTLFPTLGLCRSPGNSGTRGPLFMAPSTPSQDLVFSYLVEMISAGGRHVADC